MCKSLLDAPVLISPEGDALVSTRTNQRISIPDGARMPDVMRPQHRTVDAALSVDLRACAIVRRVSTDYPPREQATVEFWEPGSSTARTRVEFPPEAPYARGGGRWGVGGSGGPDVRVCITPDGTCWLTGPRLQRCAPDGSHQTYALECYDMSWDGRTCIGVKPPELKWAGARPRLSLFAVDTITPIHLLPLDGEHIRLSPCGRYCIWTQDGRPAVSDIETLRQTQAPSEPGLGAVRSLDVTPHATTVVMGLQDGSASLWHPWDGTLTRLLGPHRRAMVLVTVSDDGLCAIAHRFEDDVFWLRLDASGAVVETHVLFNGNCHTARFATGSHDFILVGDTHNRFQYFVERDDIPRSVELVEFPPASLPPPPQVPAPPQYPPWPQLTPQQLEAEAARLQSPVENRTAIQAEILPKKGQAHVVVQRSWRVVMPVGGRWLGGGGVHVVK